MNCTKCDVELNEENTCCEGDTYCKGCCKCEEDEKKDDCEDGGCCGCSCTK